MTAALEGRVGIHLRLAEGAVTGVRITSTRKVLACQVFRGKPVERIPVLLPLLFSVCGGAQAVAALAACDQARGLTASAAEVARRSMWLLTETAREHVWRLFLDGPALAGAAPLLEPARQAMAALSAMETVLRMDGPSSARQRDALASSLAIFTDVIAESFDVSRFDTGPQWGAWCLESQSGLACLPRFILEEGLAGMGDSRVAMLPPFDRARLIEYLENDCDGRWVAQPDWEGEVYETGPAARVAQSRLLKDITQAHGFGLMARVAGRVAELLALPARIEALIPAWADGDRQSATLESDGHGLGIVEAARGRLVHRVVAVEGQVHDYQILAPTEWNFHPQGPLVQGIRGMSAAGEDELKKRVALLVAALDPCVRYEIVVE